MNRGCGFGCGDSADELCPYLACPVLWQLARDIVRNPESSRTILQRICVVRPTSSRLKTFAFLSALCLQCVNDPHCMKEDGMPMSAQIVQSRGAGNPLSFFYSVTGRELHSRKSRVHSALPACGQYPATNNTHIHACTHTHVQT